VLAFQLSASSDMINCVCEYNRCKKGFSLNARRSDEEEAPTSSSDRLKTLCMFPSIITRTHRLTSDTLLPQTHSVVLRTKIYSREFQRWVVARWKPPTGFTLPSSFSMLTTVTTLAPPYRALSPQRPPSPLFERVLPSHSFSLDYATYRERSVWEGPENRGLYGLVDFSQLRPPPRPHKPPRQEGKGRWEEGTQYGSKDSCNNAKLSASHSHWVWSSVLLVLTL
jgi:hypothetical protein